MNKLLSNVVAVVVLSVWTVSFLADILMNEYEPSPFIHLAMMAVVGAAFGRSIFNRKDQE